MRATWWSCSASVVIIGIVDILNHGGRRGLGLFVLGAAVAVTSKERATVVPVTAVSASAELRLLRR